MDETPAKENPAKDFNKLDLSQLQGFSFGTQWTQDKPAADESRERPRRDFGDRRDGGGAERRDRRVFRRPAGSEGGTGAPSGPGPGPGGGEGPARREFSGEGGPRREFRGPRRDGPGGGERGPRQGGYGPRSEPMERGPYESPIFSVAFYPEDTSFNALARTIRSSCRTIELFEIARTVVGKADRFVVVLTRKPLPATGGPEAGAASATAPAGKQPIYLSVPDGLPFESEEAVLAHVFSQHIGRFYDLAEVEIDPPKGNFLVINKCGVTGELLGPPNYHRYTHIVQQHFATRISRMPFDAFRSRIETVRDPEVVAQWLEKMKKTTRYTWKLGAKPAPAAAPVAPAPEAAPAAEGAEAAPAAAPEAPAAITFDSFEDARAHLLANARDKMVRAVESARFHGKLLETIPPGEIRRAIEGALERQRRFPLDTANALRGRLRREHFTIFKKGSKGVSYVCAVKRKFRVPGQTFSETISALIAFIEVNAMVRAGELPAKFLGIALPAAPKPAAAPAAPAPAEGAPAAEAAAPAPAEPVLTIDERAKLSRMQGDLRWLVTEGYVTEFIDGRLFAPPPMVEARKKEVEAEEHDPENFPEAPPASVPPFERLGAATETEAPAAAESAVSETPLAETTVAEAPIEVAAPEAAPAEAAVAAEAPAPAAEPVAEAPAASAEPAVEASEPVASVAAPVEAVPVEAAPAAVPVEPVASEAAPVEAAPVEAAPAVAPVAEETAPKPETPAS